MGGAAGDSLSVANGQQFSAKDNGFMYGELEENCAKMNKGGWWYSSRCEDSLNSAFHNYAFPGYGYGGLRWQTFDTSSAIVKARMMIRASEDPKWPAAEFYTLGMVVATQGPDGTISVEIRAEDEDDYLDLDFFDRDFILV